MSFLNRSVCHWKWNGRAELKPPSCIGLVPARSGSKRILNKNVRPLASHPLMAYSIRSAIESGVFDTVVVSTDSPEFAEISAYYGAEVPFLRPSEYATDTSPDIEWIEYTLKRLAESGRNYDCFSILRPTSPFRKAETIRRAWKEFLAEEGVDSLRAVEKCHEHPAKMWILRGRRMLPLLPFGPANQPWHSSQYPTLPEVYVQNASLEIAWTRVITDGRTIAGNVLIPFLTVGDEGLDVNTEYDWQLAELMLRRNEAKLPEILMVPHDR